MHKESGYWIDDVTGKPICPGVICKCGQGGFCPAHGTTDKVMSIMKATQGNPEERERQLTALAKGK